MVAIKKLAVREENTVQWLPMSNFITNIRIGMRQFVVLAPACVARLVHVCKFLTKCPNCDTNLNYTKSILHDILTHSLAHSEIDTGFAWKQKPRHDTQRCFNLSRPKRLVNSPLGIS